MSEVIKVKRSKAPDLVLTEPAQKYLKKQLVKNSGAIGVQLSLTKTGCSGLSYSFNFIDKEIEIDRKFIFDDLTVYIENKSYPYLKGLNIDFVKEGLNNKYVYSNPNQTGACGCGESFTIDDEI
tara:strand:- start:524 stop:895 length:372 start_codon:yes stop_codon:yes gene_type:complete